MGLLAITPELTALYTVVLLIISLIVIYFMCKLCDWHCRWTPSAESTSVIIISTSTAFNSVGCYLILLTWSYWIFFQIWSKLIRKKLGFLKNHWRQYPIKPHVYWCRRLFTQDSNTLSSYFYRHLFNKWLTYTEVVLINVLIEIYYANNIKNNIYSPC